MLRCTRNFWGAAREVRLKEAQSQPQGPAPVRKSGRLGAAEARIEAALDRLDAALGTQAEDLGSVTRLQEENAALRQTRAEVSGRLDAAIERLRRVLAH